MRKRVKEAMADDSSQEILGFCDTSLQRREGPRPASFLTFRFPQRPQGRPRTLANEEGLELSHADGQPSTPWLLLMSPRREQPHRGAGGHPTHHGGHRKTTVQKLCNNSERRGLARKSRTHRARRQLARDGVPS